MQFWERKGTSIFHYTISDCHLHSATKHQSQCSRAEPNPNLTNIKKVISCSCSRFVLLLQRPQASRGKSCFSLTPRCSIVIHASPACHSTHLAPQKTLTSREFLRQVTCVRWDCDVTLARRGCNDDVLTLFSRSMRSVRISLRIFACQKDSEVLRVYWSD